jgi:hypothetical protein
MVEKGMAIRGGKDGKDRENGEGKEGGKVREESKVKERRQGANGEEK